MKRKNYRITLHGCLVATKHAWNSARREVPALVREIALRENQYYTLSEEKNEKNPDGEFVRGYQIWRGQLDGMTVKFEIEKEISE